MTTETTSRCRAREPEQTQRKVLYLHWSSAREEEVTELLDDWQVIRVGSVQEARAAMQDCPFRVALVRFGELDHERQVAFEQLVEESPPLYWIALIDADSAEQSTFSQLIYDYFFDYYTLPLTDKIPFLSATLGHAYGLGALCDAEHEQRRYQEECQMVGASPAIRLVFSQIRKVAGVDATVLIAGNSGTGKELVARAIHQRSRRRLGPFVALNCGALPENLVQAELFGHEKGAFTGAHCRKIGRIEAATGGTLFLDEIGDLPLSLQVNLLRFLQEETIERLGGHETLYIDARVIAATHRDLEDEIKQGAFREDLYYRLNVLSIEVPDLKERDGDIELLANFFFRKFTEGRQHKVRGFSRKAMAAMNRHDWPGNVREMINRVRKAIVMSDNRLITATDLGLNKGGSEGTVPTLEQARHQAERQAIRCSLKKADHNVTSAARMLGVSRVTLYRLMEKHRLNEAGKN
ncbi:sigma-54 dependent transcriptional regulator [Oceanisphaera arctica]|uniref:Sigma-54-dependent Fis family transcriptional regulator n=1 Tax=Oceanisphaera arctica TaxID=641510 RepID=A0A2P5TPF0_9GAMM|nr:sigma-54 dependent transcriptional regulator [Oceanisphaera arctica]PPL17524.1 sigma-54-dependent Fis family transcriptional regulator [Oceanisphaera arctica]